jgi:hypothetical protein
MLALEKNLNASILGIACDSDSAGNPNKLAQAFFG